MKTALDHMENFVRGVADFVNNSPEISDVDRDNALRLVTEFKERQYPQILQGMRPVPRIQRWTETNQNYLDQADAMEQAGYQTVSDWVADRASEFQRYV